MPPTAVWMASWTSATLICYRAAFCTIHHEVQVRLTGNLEHSQVRDAPDVAHNAGDLVGLILEQMQIAAVDLGGKLALDSADCLLHVVFDRLREAPDHAREFFSRAASFMAAIRFVFVLVKDRAPLLLRLQTHEVFGIEKSGVVGPVIRTAGLTGALGHFGKGAKQDSGLIRDPDAFTGPCALSKSAAHPQRAFIQVRKEFGADDATEGKIDRESEADDANADGEHIADG